MYTVYCCFEVISYVKVKLETKLLGTTNAAFDVTGQ
jgi:hypothetical protein